MSAQTVPAPIAKPLYASVGAGRAAYDAAAQAVRTLPGSYATVARARQDALAAQVAALRGAARTQARLQLDGLRGYATGLPATVTTLPQQVAGRVAALQQDVAARLSRVGESVTSSYDEYATRGERLVAALRADAPAPVPPEA